jgi:hypothetical protein
MNIDTVFEFIKEKRGYDIPLRYKLINGISLSDDELNVKGDLDLRRTKITTLPDNLMVGGFLDLIYSDIVSLPDNLMVGGFLDLRATNITSLPDNLSVGRACYLSHLNINSIPNNFNVYGNLYLRGTPIIRKYDYREIRKMIEDKGGSVGGGVIFT